MVEWRSVLLSIGFIVLCFFAVPIRINNVKEVEERVMFDTYIKNYNKTYDINSKEYNRRFEIFQESLKQIQLLNHQQNVSSPTAFYGLTAFADIDKTEFDDQYLMYKHKNNSHSRHRVQLKYRKHRFKRALGNGLPRSVDWRKKCVTEIKNQGACGACWAFSTVGIIESMLAIKTGILQTLSTQEVIDCARNGNMGCDGGDTCILLQWLVDNNVGIQKEKDYPLVLKTGVCKLKQFEKGIHVAANYTCDYLVGEEDTILALLAYHGPVAVAVNALTWQFYLGGIIQFHCDSALENLNHAVQLVGYNLDSIPPYYIARNSWGKKFGESGYLKIAIGSNVCGLSNSIDSCIQNQLIMRGDPQISGLISALIIGALLSLFFTVRIVINYV